MKINCIFFFFFVLMVTRLSRYARLCLFEFIERFFFKLKRVFVESAIEYVVQCVSYIRSDNDYRVSSKRLRNKP